MDVDVFGREERTLGRAQQALEAGLVCGPGRDCFAGLVKEYDRLFRHTRRMVAMGDRFQGSLNELNQRLAASEERYRSIFENMVEGVFRTEDSPESAQKALAGNTQHASQPGVSGAVQAAHNAAEHPGVATRLVEANPALAAMFGCDDAANFLAACGSVGALFASPMEREGFFALLRRDGETRGFQAELQRPDGTRFWAQLSGRVQQEKACGAEAAQSPRQAQPVVGVVVDVSERRRMLEEIYRLARTDSLTGLWNRGYFMDLACRELARSSRDASPLSLIMIDVDHFKKVNDTHGHEAGDDALRSLAEVLALSVREGDLVARLGGEEFVALLPNARTADACGVAERIREGIRCRELGCRSGASFGLTVSVGVATHRNRETLLEELLRCADEALYAAKRAGRDRVEIFGGLA